MKYILPVLCAISGVLLIIEGFSQPEPSLAVDLGLLWIIVGTLATRIELRTPSR